MDRKLVLALDVESPEEGLRILDKIHDRDLIIKVGYTLFIRDGINIVKQIRERGYPVFLDLKLHDIPNTVYNGVKAALDLGVDYLTLHALGGKEMLEAACLAKEGAGLKLLAVTILTSHSLEYPSFLESRLTVPQLALKLADMAIQVGIDGIVCSPHEVRKMKESIKKPFISVVPGIRLESEKTDDQTRIATPENAIRDGADMIVVGRPILKAEDKNYMIRKIKERIV